MRNGLSSLHFCLVHFTNRTRANNLFCSFSASWLFHGCSRLYAISWALDPLLSNFQQKRALSYIYCFSVSSLREVCVFMFLARLIAVFLTVIIVFLTPFVTLFVALPFSLPFLQPLPGLPGLSASQPLCHAALSSCHVVRRPFHTLPCRAPLYINQKHLYNL